LVCGVLCGVEGYLESAATGWLAGLNAARLALGEEPLVPPEDAMLGGLVRYLSSANPDHFQPMNANWGLVPADSGKGKKAEKRTRMFRRGLQQFQDWSGRFGAAPQSGTGEALLASAEIPTGSG
ncbi:MAG: FAD-dependent oxidoreductase, partial [Meiothermus sp.]|nr:FAD-dependent oxidoreductase [Meiothermus sp.]